MYASIALSQCIKSFTNHTSYKYMKEIEKKFPELYIKLIPLDEWKETEKETQYSSKTLDLFE